MRFTKMHGIGNDYVYVDCFSESVSAPASLAQRIADRHFGVGADGLILILPSEQADVGMRMFNADGSEAEMCGNGIRGLAKYVYERGMIDNTTIGVETGAGVLRVALTVEDDSVVAATVDMGTPGLSRSEIPMLGEPANEPVIDQPLEVNGDSFEVTCVSMGNPHCVIFVDDVDRFAVDNIGPLLENHELFPERINVEFVTVLDRAHVKMRVWERGAGETLACGTGASASVV
ncbi:MAG: diaminopimelate epimerase, partial [Phycisphaerae bacterium]|nr:diaminopimelate epimerase [Phycisphaerae bacterium]